LLFGDLERKDRLNNKRYGLMFDKLDFDAVEFGGKSGVFL
jgi:hypothetical protein